MQTLARLSLLAAIAALAACASRPDAKPEADTAAQEAAYQQCLQDNMAVAMAWEAVEEMCRERTSGEDHPLDYYPPEEP